jgi:hypothetical protein
VRRDDPAAVPDRWCRGVFPHAWRGRLDGLLTYWREHNALCERALDTLAFNTLVVDPRHGDWRWRRAKIARFVGITPAPEPTPSVADLARLVGRYRVDWKGEVRECVVGLADGRLVIDGLFWPQNGLLWKRDNVFDVEAWPFEVVFELAAQADRAATLVVRGPIAGDEEAGTARTV